MKGANRLERWGCEVRAWPIYWLWYRRPWRERSQLELVWAWLPDGLDFTPLTETTFSLFKSGHCDEPLVEGTLAELQDWAVRR